MTRLGLVDYGMGNLHSVQRAFERLGAEVAPVRGAAAMEDCAALVLPGVGAFDPAMERLAAADLVDPLRRSCAVGRPLLGICLGLQLLFERSDEGRREGLGLLPGHVAALPRWAGHPIPHMGWAPLQPVQPSPLLPSGSPDTWVYFVHSYAAVPADAACVTARVAWGEDAVTAAVWRGGLAACQFHPEKSSEAGAAMLRRWLSWVEHG
ncbi:MAG: imidazole glycerol phosphate synthase subunit HisH [Cyanobacteria bacterium K_Offshore_surface_m2_239]|nr:imidazole glycerol phosphate synthase subunit HisH [Cyanobacteria bacterium K_Offshore_surface_m2_239]